jgi:sec-independent protein translocase protein TatA
MMPLSIHPTKKRNNTMLQNMGIGEWVVVLVIVLIFFGPKNLPKLAQSIGKSVRELKNGLNGLGDDLKETLTSPPDQPVKPRTEAKAETQPAAQEKTGDTESNSTTV